MKSIEMIVAEVNSGIVEELVRLCGRDVDAYRKLSAQFITDASMQKMLVERTLCRISHDASLSDIMTSLSSLGLPSDPRDHMARLQAAIERVGEALQRDAALMTRRAGDADRTEDASNG